MTTVAVILAGGRSSRMAGMDKPLLDLDGRTIIEWILERISSQLGRIAINANGDAGRYAMTGAPILPDPVDGYVGPLAGILAGMEWALAEGAAHVVTTAGDTPFFPLDLVERLSNACKPGVVAVAASGGRIHPTFALWPAVLAPSLHQHLMDGGSRRVTDFLALHATVQVDFPPVKLPGGSVDPFFNINTRADLEEARRLLTSDAA